MFKIRKTYYLSFFVIFLFATASLFSQNDKNPFEIEAHLQKHNFNTADVSTNPFDIQQNKKITPILLNKTKKLSKSSKTETTSYKSFLFITTMITLIIMTFVMVFYRELLEKFFQGFLNENILNILHRKRISIRLPIFILFFSLFSINGGVFVFHIVNHFFELPGNNYFLLLFYSIFILTSVYLLKSLLLKILGFVFPIKKQTGIYAFSITIFYIIFGVILLPLNIIIAYSPTPISVFTIYISIILFALLMIFRSFRGLLTGISFVRLHKFHFFLYLCTVEIIPVIIMLKLLSTHLTK